MSKELIPQKKEVSLREMVDNFANQLENVKTTTDETRGTATISGKRGGKNVSVTIDSSDYGETRSFSVYDDLSRKSDYKDEVKRLYRQGLKQREIALRLGISQSLVSKLLNE